MRGCLRPSCDSGASIAGTGKRSLLEPTACTLAGGFLSPGSAVGCVFLRHGATAGIGEPLRSNSCVRLLALDCASDSPRCAMPPLGTTVGTRLGAGVESLSGGGLTELIGRTVGAASAQSQPVVTKPAGRESRPPGRWSSCFRVSTLRRQFGQHACSAAVDFRGSRRLVESNPLAQLRDRGSWGTTAARTRRSASLGCRSASSRRSLILRTPRVPRDEPGGFRRNC